MSREVISQKLARMCEYILKRSPKSFTGILLRRGAEIVRNVETCSAQLLAKLLGCFIQAAAAEGWEHVAFRLCRIVTKTTG